VGALLPKSDILLEPEARFLPVAAGDLLEGKWRIEKRLGAGGMGTVLLAHDLGLYRKVAVKLLAPGLCADARSLERFEREAQVTAGLEHPNIIPVYACGTHAGRPFIVMKYLDGAPLSSELAAGRRPWSVVAQLTPFAQQLCDGLSYIHRRGLVHRDIKPSNIFLAANGHVTLLDFGILRITTASSGTTGDVMGSVGWMAPEQLRGERVDARADIYAAGLVLLALITDNVVLATRQGISTRALQLGGLQPDLNEGAGQLPKPVWNVLMRALSPRQEDRFPTAEELHTALSEAASERVPSGSLLRRIVYAGFSLLVLLALISGVRAAARLESTTPTSSTSTSATSTSAAATPHPPLAQPIAEAITAGPPPADPSRPIIPSSNPTRRSPRTKPSARAATLRVVTMHKGEPTWAELLVDGRRGGMTPLAVRLPPGAHNIRVLREGFQPEERRVLLESGANTVLKIELHP
jgi:eukaryotic-like serine/threonine-protein kinase